VHLDAGKAAHVSTSAQAISGFDRSCARNAGSTLIDVAERCPNERSWSFNHRESGECRFSYGWMPHDLARANIMLFAEKVLLRLHAVAVDMGADPPQAGLALAR